MRGTTLRPFINSLSKLLRASDEVMKKSIEEIAKQHLVDCESYFDGELLLETEGISNFGDEYLKRKNKVEASEMELRLALNKEIQDKICYYGDLIIETLKKNG